MRRTEDSYHQFEGNEEAIMQKIEGIYNECRNGNLSQSVAINKIMTLHAELDRYTKAQERTKLEKLGNEFGFESLGTDQQGRRTSAQLEQSGLAFATGEAGPCLAVAVVHPDWGMAAAHYNPINAKVVKENLTLRLQGKNTSDPTRAHPMVSNENLSTHITQTVQKAFNQFFEIHPRERVIPDGTQAHLIGLDFLPPSHQENTIQLAVTSIRDVVQSQLRGSHSKTNLQISPHLGESGGVIYGGTTHPLYSQPQTYTLS